ncbi:hypothetical protein HPB52_006444 [Rhipicephalus sanguineus]|uniref:Uncharacterized protein n=1 Tax=Rhipicephalus sanguineus TaxID=34632 RepID=A0A9D4PM21_RHISA|nr:hypothetical protein HPB52_006444 [Rhipicephalus sanguineus]
MDPARTRLTWSAVPSMEAPAEVPELEGDAGSPGPLQEPDPQEGPSGLCRGHAGSPGPLQEPDPQEGPSGLCRGDAGSPGPLQEPDTQEGPSGLCRGDAGSPGPLQEPDPQPGPSGLCRGTPCHGTPTGRRLGIKPTLTGIVLSSTMPQLHSYCEELM